MPPLSFCRSATSLQTPQTSTHNYYLVKKSSNVSWAFATAVTQAVLIHQRNKSNLGQKKIVEVQICLRRQIMLEKPGTLSN